ncbi:hypothetical protein D6817_05060 [Candidatus Pacearchaeota archaeon]|nr:MAG: hypothetical protein D6817_05060 [Candidatus Pacearchaeota archaeon]
MSFRGRVFAVFVALLLVGVVAAGAAFFLFERTPENLKMIQLARNIMFFILFFLGIVVLSWFANKLRSE